jgi:heme oxygenase
LLLPAREHAVGVRNGTPWQLLLGPGLLLVQQHAFRSQQILKNIAQKAMNMNGDDGLRFYVFNDISDEKAFKTMYRSTMDELPIDQAMADRIVEEANNAFHLNMKMFQELEGNLVAAIGKVLFGFLTRRQRTGSTEAATA